MIISKIATDTHGFRRSFRAFDSARAALKALLIAEHLGDNDVVLLPAYIGWSPREGSGVFDPIAALGLRYAFYRVDAGLNIDLEHFEQVLSSRRAKVVVLIHYFGRVDPQAARVSDLAKRAGAMVVEDAAHAMLTDLVTGAAGHLGDASIFSLHKLLPVSTCGLLMLNGSAPLPSIGEGGMRDLPWNFDLHAIAQRRLANVKLVQDLIVDLAGDVKPLWPQWPANCVPQTFPVLLDAGLRDLVYRSLNGRGYGVVSLYHTLVDVIGKDEFNESHMLSRRILNLPVHQDVDANALRALMRELEACVTSQRRLA
jgi:dTDP-4-amino-4,6-dideoxygalactose transaminase